MLFPDAARNEVKIWQCTDCFSHVPETAFATEKSRSVSGQAKFHETFWADCSSEEMQKLRDDLRSMVRLMRGELGPTSADHLLVEIGAGRGGLLRALLDEGYVAQGCEPAGQLVAMARQHFDLDENQLFQEPADVFLDRLASAQLRPTVIILWHVLEHMSEPYDILARCIESLAPNGSLILQLPLIDSRYVYPAHYFFVTPESIPVIAEHLGGLPYRFQIDFDNKYITAYFGACAEIAGQAGTQVIADASTTDPTWRAARARAEPALTRDGAISGLLDAQGMKNEELLQMGFANDRLLGESSEMNEAAAEALRRLEWADQVDEANLRLIAQLSARLDAELARGSGEIEQIKALLTERDQTIQAQTQSIVTLKAELAHHAETSARLEQANLAMDRTLRDQDTALTAQTVRLEEQVHALRRSEEAFARQELDRGRLNDLLARERSRAEELARSVSDLSVALRNEEEARRAVTHDLEIAHRFCAQKDDAIRAQASLIDERWDAMQEMGAAIASRDAALAEQRTEMDWVMRQLDSTREHSERTRYNLASVSEYLDALDGNAIARGMRKIGLLPTEPVTVAVARSKKFAARAHNRYWWHRSGRTGYVPLIYDFLEPREWTLLEAWFDDTELKYENTGEANVPPLSLLFGLISGNGLSRIVQCGHYVGYSTLLIGFLLRRMGRRRSLYSIDVDPEVTAYTKHWLRRAGLTQQVALSLGDSAHASQVDGAMAYLGGRPELVFIDSSHQYAHTLRELDLWYDALPIGGLIVLHDTSLFAASLDHSGDGGVRRAVDQWCAKNERAALSLNGFVEGGRPGDHPYLDGCGLSIIQKT